MGNGGNKGIEGKGDGGRRTKKQFSTLIPKLSKIHSVIENVFYCD